MRRKLIVGNWKMNGSWDVNAALLRHLLEGFGPSGRPTPALAQVDCAVCVPFPYLCQCDAALSETPLRWGAQDVCEHPAGAYTGEVSAAMLSDLSCRYVIVGHSERRSLFGEDDALVARKARAALGAGMIPIVCVGETLAERDAGQGNAVVLRQLDAVLALLDPAQIENIVVAYEPVWAIGTGINATPAMVQEVHAVLRARVRAAAHEAAEKVRILYGGSMKADNAVQLLAQPDIDGGLVGRASLDAAQFLAIAAAAAR